VFLSRLRFQWTPREERSCTHAHSQQSVRRSLRRRHCIARQPMLERAEILTGGGCTRPMDRAATGTINGPGIICSPAITLIMTRVIGCRAPRCGTGTGINITVRNTATIQAVVILGQVITVAVTATGEGGTRPGVGTGKTLSHDCAKAFHIARQKPPCSRHIHVV